MTAKTTTFGVSLRGLILGAFVVLAAGLAMPGAALSQAQTQAEAEQAILARTNEATQALIDGRLNDALRLFNEIITTNAQLPRIMAAAHYHRGIIHQKRGAFNEAAADYTTALWLEELPDNMRARAHYNRGTALDNLGQQERAKQDFDLAISLAPDMSAAYNNRANVLRRVGALEAAVADYDQSIALGNPLPHLPHYGRAIAKEALGDIEGARADLEKAISLAPDYEPAGAALAALPEAPSALAVAAAPEPVKPAASAMADLADLPPAQIAIVETAMLPPPPAATPVSTPTAAPVAAPVRPQQVEAPAPISVASTPVAIRPAAVPQAQQLTQPVAGQWAQPVQAAPSIEARRITTAGTAQPVTSTKSAPMPMMGTWTTTILPAGSNAVLTLDDVTPQPALPATALRTSQETQVAAMAPQPRTGLSFPGVATEEYRQAALAPAPAPQRSYAPSSSTGYAVQLASFRSEAEAALAWESVRSSHATTLQDREHLVQRAEVPGKGTYYRLRVGPMAGKSTAAALCNTLKAEGQDCYVTKL
ncbi:tetratricopeptide repeat protein [Pyruvatibacter sp.]|uniref:SPOR domain-containing protein n=1 Tax=Pyruvatibacter sp. TaxID=1981328 RepID=UPI003265F6C8